MNSFETDMIRAITSKGFVIGFLFELLVLITAGWDSDLFRMIVPVVCTLPYTVTWLKEYEYGFVKSCLPRTSIISYIMGKFLACGISGGLLEILGVGIYNVWKWKEPLDCSYLLLFLNGFLWAEIAAVLAAWSRNRYLAYGGSFVIYYLLVILHERYFQGLYCLYPYEWFQPEHTWVFGVQGVILLLIGIISILGCIYYVILRRCLEHV